MVAEHNRQGRVNCCEIDEDGAVSWAWGTKGRLLLPQYCLRTKSYF